MILVIDNYDSFTYNLVQMMRGLGADVRVARNDAITLDEIEALRPAGIVLSPGPGRPDTAGVCLDAVRRFAGRIPILGVCLGHQTIAQAFGARIVPAARLMHGKTSRILHDGQGVFAGMPQQFQAMRYHSLAVERASLPACLAVTAESEDGEIMGIKHREFAVEGVQYHPESIGTPEGVRQLENFLASLGGPRAARPAAGDGEQRACIEEVRAGRDLSAAQMEGLIAAIMSGRMDEDALAEFLTLHHAKGTSREELSGAARAMRAAGVKIDASGRDPVDIVGTGGDGHGTFNVSTTAAFVVAGAGVAVAKHGNVAATSKCGSADVLRALGVDLDAPVATVERCLRDIGMAFLFARVMHPAMRYAAPVRKRLKHGTVFNLLGPLTNPAGARRHVIGVYAPKLAPLFAETLRDLGSVRADIVCGERGLDEISPGGMTFVSALADGKVSSSLLDAGFLYGRSFSLADIAGGDASENAAILLRVLHGEDRGAYRAAALENAAAALRVANAADSWEEAIALAADSVDSGRALAKLQNLVKLSHSR
ncbi:MAG: anthranilate phosphoribosyltransferase [Kiritimatiellae bacterium]|nr:anthranilate phosphoribosyltransferase [Kiritimatiellia bacterium]